MPPPGVSWINNTSTLLTFASVDQLAGLALGCWGFILNISKDICKFLIERKQAERCIFLNEKVIKIKSEYFDRYAGRAYNVANSCTIFSIV